MLRNYKYYLLSSLFIFNCLNLQHAYCSNSLLDQEESVIKKQKIDHTNSLTENKYLIACKLIENKKNISSLRDFLYENGEQAASKIIDQLLIENKLTITELMTKIPDREERFVMRLNNPKESENFINNLFLKRSKEEFSITEIVSLENDLKKGYKSFLYEPNGKNLKDILSELSNVKAIYAINQEKIVKFNFKLKTLDDTYSIEQLSAFRNLPEKFFFIDEQLDCSLLSSEAQIFDALLECIESDKFPNIPHYKRIKNDHSLLDPKTICKMVFQPRVN